MSRRGPYRARTYLGVLRERRGMTQRTAARRLAIQAGYLKQVETGRRRPSKALQSRMARLYAVSEREVARLVSLTCWFLAHLSPPL